MWLKAFIDKYLNLISLDSLIKFNYVPLEAITIHKEASIVVLHWPISHMIGLKGNLNERLSCIHPI